MWRADGVDIDAVMLLRGSYLSAAALVLVVFFVPAFRTRFLDYGPRSMAPTSAHAATDASDTKDQWWVYDLLDYIAGLRVPHSWFTSFYATSVACSLLWLSDIVRQGSAFQAVVSSVPVRSEGMTISQVQITWFLMLVQGSRRLYECISFSKPSATKMWFGHWALGIMFYCLTSMAVWVEGIPALRHRKLALSDLAFAAPSIKSFVGILLFILASGVQHDCHAYLASLKGKTPPNSVNSATYVMPEHPAWNLSLTPHYFVECLLYLALAIVAAPRGTPLNGTMVCALVFVAVNLGITASGTKRWYERRFGRDAVGGRARMIPGIY